MRAIVLVAGLLALLIFEPSLAVTRAESFFGTWTLDRARSHYAREAPPASMIVVIEAAPAGLAYRSETRFADGRLNTSHYVARLDRTPAVVLSTTGLMAPVSLALTKDAAIEAIYGTGRKRLAWSRWSVNQEGTELLVTTTYLDSQGEENQNVAAFRRVEPGPSTLEPVAIAEPF